MPDGKLHRIDYTKFAENKPSIETLQKLQLSYAVIGEIIEATHEVEVQALDAVIENRLTIEVFNKVAEHAEALRKWASEKLHAKRREMRGAQDDGEATEPDKSEEPVPNSEG